MRNQPAPYSLFGDPETHIPPNAIEQMDTVMRLPMATAGALMPDAHLGYAMPIGGVVALENAISPSFVGYDISCMVQLTLFDIDEVAFEKERQALADILRQETSFGVGSDFQKGRRQHAVMADPRWNDIPAARKLKAKAQKQLGSSGGGNHFADLVMVEFEKAVEGFAAGSLHVGLLTHSGSRGTGHKLATHYVKQAVAQTRATNADIVKGYEWLRFDSELGQEYFEAMSLMGEYARANHALIHEHFGISAELTPIFSVWNRHNFAWVEGDRIIHRKGATPAAKGQLGLIPGTSGTDSYLVAGLGHPDSLASSAHGAGRWFSRKEAFRRHDRPAFERHMAQHDILHYGLQADETFLAYKDIDLVMSQQEGVLVESLARLTPRVVVMGGRADDGD